MLLLVLGIVIAGFFIINLKNGIVGEAQAARAGGNILYVGGSGAGNYTKIQDAIDNANDGDTVFVYNGTYYENIVVNKRINLMGEDKNGTIIDGRYIKNTINITADDVKIINLSVIHGGKSADLSLYHVKNVTIFECDFYSGSYRGIALYYSSSSSINHCNVYDNHWRNIVFFNSYKNKVYDCNLYNADGGINLSNSSDNLIYNCSINSNVGIHNDGIIIEKHSSYNLIYNCNIHNNHYGIVFNYAENNAIYNCFLYNNSWDGIMLYFSYNNTIFNCTIYGNRNGIHLSSSLNNSIVYCNISYNEWGINSLYSSINSISNCNIYNNINYGVYSSSSASYVNACHNWWGDTSGPYHPILNPDGKGDKISNNVIFEPWLIQRAGTPQPVLYIFPISYDFGDIQLGKCSQYAFTLINLGGETAFGSIYLTGSNANQFQIVMGEGNFSLSAGQSKQIVVKFYPTTSESKIAILKAYASNCNNSVTILSGRGIDNLANSNILFNPLYGEILINQDRIMDITLTNLTNGLSGYNITITIENISIAEILDVSFPYWATLHSNASLPSNSIWIKAVDLNNNAVGVVNEISLAKIIIRGNAVGKTQVLINVKQLDDDDGNVISPIIRNATIDVLWIPPLPSCSPPNDLNGTGKYEDINGNGRLDFDDVVKFFHYLEWIQNSWLTEIVDFNDNGRIDFDDIVFLYNRL